MSTPIWTSTSSTDWSVAGNWSTASVPANTNVVWLTNSSISIDTNLAQSAVTLGEFNADKSYIGGVGTSSTYLNIGSTVFNLGLPAAANSTGSGRMNIQ